MRICINVLCLEQAKHIQLCAHGVTGSRHMVDLESLNHGMPTAECC